MRKAKILLSVALLSGCASEAMEMSVITPRPDDQYTVSSAWVTKQQAEQWANAAAAETCKKQKKRHVVLADVYKYQGLIPDKAQRYIDIAPVPKPFFRSKTDHSIELTFKCV